MVAIVNEDMKLCVKNGAAWMDENYPGWIERINLSELDMNNCYKCIIGQNSGDYFNVFKDTYSETWAEDNGFETANLDDYDQLRDAWTEYIKNHT